MQARCVPGKLSTHVLDLVSGRPAAGVKIELWRIEGGRRLLATAVTNADGRTEHPLLEAAEMAAGRYEMVFLIGEYFRTRGLGPAEPPFLDEVPVRFGLSDPTASYHVPLLVSPWAYSIYRGS